jgi:Rrf2 family protein
MKISTRGRYALRMMVEIAMHDREEWVSIKDISERQGISVKYLEQIVTNLTKSGLLLSSRGPRGGYMLAKNPDEYTAGEILRVIEGELAPVACLESGTKLCERRGVCPTIKFWEGLHQVINEYVDSVTLQDLLDFCKEVYGYDYSI